MYLENALSKAKSISELYEIFEKKVEVKIQCFQDEVKVEGYQGAVTTDFIANIVWNSKAVESKETKHLASLLADKVFSPLKELVEAPENECSLYQLFALRRMHWLSPAEVFGYSIAMRHATVLGVLDSQYLYFM